jgi:alpha-galactosidase
MARLNINENKIHMVLEITEDGNVKLLHFSSLPFCEGDIIARTREGSFNLVEIDIAGLDRPLERHGTKYIVTAPGYRMKYKEHKDYRNDKGRKLEVTTYDEETGITVISHLQFYDGISVVRSYSEVINQGKQPQTLTYISSFNYSLMCALKLIKHDELSLFEGFENKLEKEIFNSFTYEELLKNLKSKRYTLARIRRTLLRIYLKPFKK